MTKGLSQRGFSLVELSIVLVILGLLTGGILAGQSLIRAAELRSVSSEYMRFKTAIGTFRDKYFQVPGDMNNATSFWGTAAACPGIFSTAAGGTCNGNADGQIVAAATTANELFRFWQHLGYAGLIEGSYTGVPAASTYATLGSVIGQNIPNARLGNAGWSILYIGPITVTSTTYFEGSYNNAFLLGSPSTTTQSTGAVLKPEEAWNIDSKLDDGKPATGAISPFESQGGTTSSACSDIAASNSASMTASNYSLTNTGVNCSLIMNTGY